MAPSYNQVKYKKIKLGKGWTCIWGPQEKNCAVLNLKAGRGDTNYKATVHLKEQPIHKKDKLQQQKEDTGFRSRVVRGSRVSTV